MCVCVCACVPARNSLGSVVGAATGLLVGRSEVRITTGAKVFVPFYETNSPTALPCGEPQSYLTGNQIIFRS